MTTTSYDGWPLSTNDFADLLRNLLESSRSEWTQADWACLLDVSPAAVSQWVNGHTVPSAEHILRLLTVLRSHDIAKPELLASFEAAVRDMRIGSSDGNTALALAVLEGLENYGGGLHYTQAQLLKSAFMSIIDSFENRSIGVDTLLSYIRNPTASHSPYNWHFATIIGSLAARGPDEFGATLIDIAVGARMMHDELGHASGWSWMPIPAYTHRFAPDLYSRRSVTLGLAGALKHEAPQLSNYSAGRQSLERVDAILNGCAVLAYEIGYSAALEVFVSPLSCLVGDLGPTANGVVITEFLRRGRRRWLPELEFRSAVGCLSEIVETGQIPSNPGEAGGRTTFLSEGLSKLEAVPVRMQRDLEASWNFLRSGHFVQEVTEDDSVYATQLSLLDTLLNGVRQSGISAHEYIYASAVYDLLTYSIDLSAVTDAAKTEPVAFEFLRRLELDIVEDLVSRRIGRLAGCLLLDLGYQLMPDRVVCHISEAIHMSPDDLACSILSIPSLWDRPLHHHRLRNAVVHGERTRGPAVVWVLDALEELSAERPVL